LGANLSRIWAGIRLGHLRFLVLQTGIIVFAIVLTTDNKVRNKIVPALSEIWDFRYFIPITSSVLLILALLLILAVPTLDWRTKERRERDKEYEATMARLDKTFAEHDKVMEEYRRKLPLSVPASFVFIDIQTVESLYGQYEPELVPSIVRKEFEQSTGKKSSLGVNGYGSLEASEAELNKRITEYRSIEKNSERKLKELLRYLHDQGQLELFRDIEPNSEELKKLTEAKQLLSQKYGVDISENFNRRLMDQLLSEELGLIEKRLSNSRGLIFVEGEWTVALQGSMFILRRPFLNNTSRSPLCEVSISSTSISEQHKLVISSARNKPIRLSVFGNNLLGMQGNAKTVVVTPIAVY
jgi:hypothetical protein